MGPGRNDAQPSRRRPRHHSQELRAIYGPARYDRLATIKTRYDPRNLFRMNHNITPGITTSLKPKEATWC